MNTFYSLNKKLIHAVRILGIRFLYDKIIAPQGLLEDERRKEFILNIILVGTLFLLGLLWVSLLISYLRPQQTFSGLPIPGFTVVIFFFAGLLILSRKGWVRLSSLLLITSYSLLTIYCVYEWSFVLPMVILSSLLTIVIASLLISTRFSFILTGILVGVISFITLLQTRKIIPLDLYWQHDVVSIQDVFEMGFIFFAISGLSWLSNKETEKSLRRARTSEKALLEERNLLEQKVEERTKEIKDMERAQITHLSRMADLGRLSSGIFHDLMNPLTSIIASIDQIPDPETHIPHVREYLIKATAASKRLGGYLETIRKQIRPSTEHRTFSVSKEISDAIDILGHKARIAQVSCTYAKNQDRLLTGNPLLFHQVILNLISNGIDSYKTVPSTHKKQVNIICHEDENYLKVHVQDFGCGIPSEYQDKIFTPFFSTKQEGLGIGLSHIQKIVENDFHGEISFSSHFGKGSCFSVVFPKTFTSL